ncbi:lipoprotein, putative [Bacillus pumilus ATCC 7061]|nr:lipoprotein, putative [Bacillus pumilus ATCC 7061]
MDGRLGPPSFLSSWSVLFSFPFGFCSFGAGCFFMKSTSFVLRIYTIGRNHTKKDKHMSKRKK